MVKLKNHFCLKPVILIKRVTKNVYLTNSFVYFMQLYQNIHKCNKCNDQNCKDLVARKLNGILSLEYKEESRSDDSTGFSSEDGKFCAQNCVIRLT